MQYIFATKSLKIIKLTKFLRTLHSFVGYTRTHSNNGSSTFMSYPSHIYILFLKYYDK